MRNHPPKRLTSLAMTKSTSLMSLIRLLYGVRIIRCNLCHRRRRRRDIGCPVTGKFLLSPRLKQPCATLQHPLVSSQGPPGMQLHGSPTSGLLFTSLLLIKSFDFCAPTLTCMESCENRLEGREWLGNEGLHWHSHFGCHVSIMTRSTPWHVGQQNRAPHFLCHHASALLQPDQLQPPLRRQADPPRTLQVG